MKTNTTILVVATALTAAVASAQGVVVPAPVAPHSVAHRTVLPNGTVMPVGAKICSHCGGTGVREHTFKRDTKCRHCDGYGYRMNDSVVVVPPPPPKPAVVVPPPPKPVVVAPPAPVVTPSAPVVVAPPPPRRPVGTVLPNGTVMPVGAKICSHCGGTGIREHTFKDKKCHHCNGYGYRTKDDFDEPSPHKKHSKHHH